MRPCFQIDRHLLHGQLPKQTAHLLGSDGSAEPDRLRGGAGQGVRQLQVVRPPSGPQGQNRVSRKHAVRHHPRLGPLHVRHCTLRGGACMISGIKLQASVYCDVLAFFAFSFQCCFTSTHARARTHTHTHTRMRARARTHARTRTHAHARTVKSEILPFGRSCIISSFMHSQRYNRMKRDRQINRQTETQTDRQTDRQSDRERQRQGTKE